MSMMTSSVLKWQQQPRNSPITVGDLVVLLVCLLWVAGCVVVMLMARRRRRSGWGWFFIAQSPSAKSTEVGAVAFQAGRISCTTPIAVVVSPTRSPRIGVSLLRSSWRSGRCFHRQSPMV
jgi:hypothetical protein